MDVSEGNSKRLLVVTSSECIEEDQTDKNNTMDVLVKAATEAREGNIKKSVVELNDGLKECKGNEDLFLSKLIELDFQDLEMLYVAFCGSEKKRKGSKLGSFKKKSSVGDASFTNEGFEVEFKSDQNSWGRGKKKSQGNINEESDICLSCLRKAYNLQREIKMADLKEDIFKLVLETHIKVENYYPCVLLLAESQHKYTDKKILSLNNQQKYAMFDICMSIVTNILKDGSMPDVSEGNQCINYCILAIKLLPSIMKPHSILCNIYKMRNETKRACQIATSFLQEVDPKNDYIMLLLVLCQVDEGKTQSVLKRLNNMEQNGLQLTKNMVATRGLLLIISGYIEQGVKILTDMKLSDEKETITGVVELMKSNQLLHILENAKTYIEDKIEKNKNTKSETIKDQLQEERNFLKLVCQTLTRKNPNDLSLARIYCDCLILCEEFSMIENYLTNQIHQHPMEILPVIYLANARLKMGAYNAACQDFRALLQLSGEEKLIENLSLLSIEDRMEIARVHRLHGFRYLDKEFAFQDGVECFSVAISAVGKSSIGLILTRGYCYMHLNHFDLASKDFNYCIRKDESSAPALCARAVLYAVTTHVEEAITDFQKAFTSEINSCYQSLVKLPLEHVSIFCQLVIQFVKQEIERVRNRDKMRNEKVELSDTDCWKESDFRREPSGSDFNSQVLNYSEFLCNLFPENIDYWSTRVACLHVSSGSNAALFEVNHALSKFPNEDSLIIWKGVLLLHQQQFDEAIIQFKDYKSSEDLMDIISYIHINLRNQFHEVLLRKAKTLQETECYDDALKLYNFSILLSNKNIASLRGRMECFDKIGETKNWLKDLNETMTLQPTSDYACLRAQYYIAHGMELDACEDYITALTLNERNTINIVIKNSNTETVTKLFYNHALNALGLKNMEDVIKYCEAGLKFNPNDKRLRQLKERTNLESNKCTVQ